MDVVDNSSVKYRLKLRYGGYFQKVKNTSRKRYCFGYQKCVYIDTSVYMLEDLNDEVRNRYPTNKGIVFSMWYVDKSVLERPFIQLLTMDDFKLMIIMYEMEKEVTIYVTIDGDDDTNSTIQRAEVVVVDEVVDEIVHESSKGEESEYCLSDESYHSQYHTDDDVEYLSDESSLEGDTHSQSKKTPTMNEKSIFSNVVEFRRALSHYAIANEFEYFIEKSDQTRFTAKCTSKECNWRIHASIMQDSVSFQVKKFVDTHCCTRSNKGGNKLASQGWVASVISDKLKSDGDVPVTVLKKWVMKNYNVDVPYLRVFRGKEQAYNEIYGKWEDSFLKMNDFKEELLNRNPGSVVDIDFEVKNKKKHFLRFFISLAACSRGFLNGCRPYRAEKFDRLMNEIGDVRKDALTYITENHTKIWSRSKFGTNSKCDYITNNILEAFNSWIGELRYQPVLDLLDSIRGKIMTRFDKKREILKTWKGTTVPNAKRYLNKISKNLGEYEVCRSGEFRGEVTYKGRRWEVLLDKQQCTCRVWQVKGLPCFHAAAFIAFIRDNWDRHVDPYFTIEKYKSAYAMEIAPMPAKDQWVCINKEEKIYPPSIKRPSGRPRKNMIKSHDETKKRHKCSRCGGYGHHGKTCKNSVSQAHDPDQPSTGRNGRGKRAKDDES